MTGWMKKTITKKSRDKAASVIRVIVLQITFSLYNKSLKTHSEESRLQLHFPMTVRAPELLHCTVILLCGGSLWVSGVEVKEAERTPVCDNNLNITCEAQKKKEKKRGGSVWSLTDTTRGVIGARSETSFCFRTPKLEFTSELQHHPDCHRKWPHGPKKRKRMC